MQITVENIRELKEVVKRETPGLMRKKGVMSVGVALKLRNGKPTETLCIRVTVKKKKEQKLPGENQTETGGTGGQPAPATRPPAENSQPIERTEAPRLEGVIRIPGYPVDVIEIADKVAPEERKCPTPESEARTGTYDELKGGIAIYAEQDGVKQPYGTLGMVVYDRLTCRPIILTSRDILGALSINKKGQLEHSDLIYQGTSGTPVGEAYKSDLDYYEASDDLVFTSNFLLIKPTGEREPSTEVEGIEFERIFLEPQYGMKVWKSGARTGVTQGIITQVEGYDFRVGGVSAIPFACEGDTGAIVFGEKDGKKRPVGILTRFIDELGEVRCVSLRPALIANPGLDISLTFNCVADVVHEFNNPSYHLHAYTNLSQGYSDSQLGLQYQYREPKFISLSKYEPNAKPLYCWHNHELNRYHYSTDNGSCKDNFVGITAYISTVQQEGMVPLYLYEKPTDSDMRLVTQGEVIAMTQDGYSNAGIGCSQNRSNLLNTQGPNDIIENTNGRVGYVKDKSAKVMPFENFMDLTVEIMANRIKELVDKRTGGAEEEEILSIFLMFSADTYFIKLLKKLSSMRDGRKTYLERLYEDMHNDNFDLYLKIYNAKLVALHAKGNSSLEKSISKLEAGQGVKSVHVYAPSEITSPGTWSYREYPQKAKYDMKGIVDIRWNVHDGITAINAKHHYYQLSFSDIALVKFRENNYEPRLMTAPEMIALTKEHVSSARFAKLFLITLPLSVGSSFAKTLIGKSLLNVAKVTFQVATQYIIDHQEEIMKMEGGPAFLRVWKIFNLALLAYHVVPFFVRGGYRLLNRVQDSSEDLVTKNSGNTVANGVMSETSKVSTVLLETKQKIDLIKARLTNSQLYKVLLIDPRNKGQVYNVYLGIDKINREIVYVGITLQGITKRAAQHISKGRNFEIAQINLTPLYYRQARAIEEAFYVYNKSKGLDEVFGLRMFNVDFENAIHSIRLSRSWRPEALEWGEMWLQYHNYIPFK
ncbi:MAG: hypothetical protein OEV42_06650 [Deltaproteobacteria bacterium]|nr:hypothetical protein [Deltaproteobacteria bacterium]